jgi:hypothetical protein
VVDSISQRHCRMNSRILIVPMRIVKRLLQGRCFENGDQSQVLDQEPDSIALLYDIWAETVFTREPQVISSNYYKRTVSNMLL